MPTGVVSTRVDDWLWSTLRSGVSSVSNRVYVDDSAPVGVTTPYVQWSLLSSLTVTVLEGTRILQHLVYIVQAIDRSGTWDTVETAADQIYSSLHKQRGTTTGAIIDSCICEEEIRRTESEEGGTRFRYLGWRVRIEAESV